MSADSRARAPRSRFVRGGGVAALVVGLAALAGLAGCRAAPARAPVTRAVTIHGMQFDPPVLHAAIGDTVRWTNRDLVPHTVTARAGVFDSRSLAPDSTWDWIVRGAEPKEYFCGFHPTMHGTLVVPPAR